MKRTVLSLTLIALMVSIFSGGCAKKVPPPPPPPVEEKKPEPKIEEPVVKPEPKPKLELKNVYFEFDKYRLTAEAKAILNDNAKQLMDSPTIRVRLEGHCDERGTNAYNLSLGEKRANAVKNFLIQYGIGANRIETISYGEERPVCTEHNENCWWRNRRVEFNVISK
ncbi:peptidoglycan-associated lipoprotein Pal [bacterium]|nr:MAG: peptidoglycan-associated lipoprotein Pal [bacterium]